PQDQEHSWVPSCSCTDDQRAGGQSTLASLPADYGLREFVLDLSAMIERVRPGPLLVDSVCRRIQRLIHSAGLTGAALERRLDRGYARNLLYRDPAGRFIVVGLVWEPGHCTPIHDHGTW